MICILSDHHDLYFIRFLMRSQDLYLIRLQDLYLIRSQDLDLSDYRICIWSDHRICIWSDHRICIWSDQMISIWSDYRIRIFDQITGSVYLIRSQDLYLIRLQDLYLIRSQDQYLIRSQDLYIWSDHRICIWPDHSICIWSDHRICIWPDHRICIWSDDSESDLDLIRTSCLDLSWLIRCLWSRFEQMFLEFHCFITLSDKFPLPVLGHRWEKLLKYIDRFLNKYRVQSNEKKSNAKKCPKASWSHRGTPTRSLPTKHLKLGVKKYYALISYSLDIFNSFRKYLCRGIEP